MKDNSPLPFDSRPVVLLLANPSGLSLSVAESLLANFCRVNIVSEKKKEWEDKTGHLSGNSAITVFDFTESLSLESFDYAVYVDGGPDKDLENKTYSFLSLLYEERGVKTLLVLPYIRYAKEQEESARKAGKFYKDRKESVGLIYIGQPLGPRVNLGNRDLLSNILHSSITKGEVIAPSKDNVLYPIHVSLAAKEIVKLLFSFGGVGRKTALIGQKTNVGELVKNLKRLVSPLKVKYKEGAWEHTVPKGVSEEVLSLGLKKSLKETLEWYSSHPPDPKKVGQKVEKADGEKREDRGVEFSRIELPQLKPSPRKLFASISFVNRKIIAAVGVFLFLLTLPYLLIGLSGGALLFSKNNFFKGKLARSRVLNSAAKVAASTSRAELKVLVRIPYMGGVFEDARRASVLLSELGGLMDRTNSVAAMSNEFFKKALGEKEYDVSQYSTPISLELSSLYTELSFLESEYDRDEGISGWVFDKALGEAVLSEAREKLLPAERIAKEAPLLLGQDGPKRYLVLFQNNMELRPTGGFIGSFALVTFDSGKLTDISVQDVYSADGQLQGHIEPPAPIKEHLGEANWYLRDSNWDPDFSVSAQRAEWFLDKEIDTAVDGVVGVDLEFAKSLVRVVGSIYLDDFDREITASNLYEVTQYEVEKDFFPGSRKKSNFLTSLTKELLNQLLNVKEEKHIDTALAMVESLENKHIQVFLHNNQAQRAFADLGWSGAVYQPTCSGNCYADYFGIVEANLGVNKANYFIRRSANLNIRLGERVVKHTLELNIENAANTALGDEGVYENYVRVFAPQEATFGEVVVEGPNSQETNIPEIEEASGRKEAGAFVEIAPGQRRVVTYTWEVPADLSFEESGQFRLLWRKQAGTLSDAIDVSISGFLPQNLLFIPEVSLTEEGAYRYNTELTEDFAPRIFW